MTALRSALFFCWFVLASVVIHLAFLPAFVMPRRVALTAGAVWCNAVLWGLDVFAGMRLEVRGTIPADGALVAAKHMSMLDTIALFARMNRPYFVYRKTLEAIPFFGWYIRRSGMIAVDRDGGASALKQMAAAAKAAIAGGHAVIIFPEGTRKAPDAAPAYKPGIAALYGQLDQPCVPVALNTGLFWTGPIGLIKRKGTVVVEFLDAIPPGLKRREFMAILEDRIEAASRALVAEGRTQLAE